MKVKFIKYHRLFAHDKGDVAELIDSDAKMLIESKHAVAFSEKKGESQEEETEQEEGAGQESETAESKHKAEKATGKNQRGK